MPTSRSQSGSVIMDENLIEQLSVKVCQRLEDHLNKKLGKIENKISELSNRFEEKIEEISSKMSDITDSMVSNNAKITDITEKLNNIEAAHKRNSLRFDGIAESDNENLMSVLINICCNILKVKCCSTDINNIYRQGKFDVGRKPRTILQKYKNICKRRFN
ncbi:unnamed protein product [Psylliodes chrysocephalus]|uniref:Uncharacterized protein n=1 Tax=Psylliodes chrysocephalus TaxID=3402493 RepID=A0A9P0GH34_9CUCU|nr:unnamed protein product [Psylliodes chrysocephala]